MKKKPMWEERKPYEPAPLNCERGIGAVDSEGRRLEAGCGLTMHEYVGNKNMSQIGARNYHDIYRCMKCGTERVWG